MNSRKESNIPWWAIVLGFVIYAPIGFILLFMNLAGVQVPTSKTRAQRQFEQDFRRSAQAAQAAQNAQRRQTPGASATGSTYHYAYGKTTGQQTGQTTGQTGQAQGQTAGKAQSTGTRARFFKKPRNGKAMTIVGSVMTFIFSLGFIDELIDAFRWGFSYRLTGLISLLGFLCAGAFLAATGITKSRRAKRAKLYQNVIGQRSSIFLNDLAATAGVSKKQVLTDLQNMLADGTLPSGYIDQASGRLILTDLGFQPPEAAQVKTEKKAEPQTRAQQPKEDPDDALLRQIREVNDAIPGEEMSRKIDRIEEITRKILAYQKNNPSKSAELRQFLNYYLPTTLKILNAYAQMDAQGIEGENITAAKRRIEGMMDKVVEGFEKQLDQLFSTDAMDIATDVEVLERMLDKDGLGSGMTMGG